MLRWAFIFFVISIVAGTIGFTRSSATTGPITKIAFFIAPTLFLIFLIMALIGGEALL